MSAGRERDYKELARIRTRGNLDDDLVVIDVIDAKCGDLQHAIGARWNGSNGCFLISWADFERAYVEIKRLRELAGTPAECAAIYGKDE